jgi:hypothetical protein
MSAFYCQKWTLNQIWNWGLCQKLPSIFNFGSYLSRLDMKLKLMLQFSQKWLIQEIGAGKKIQKVVTSVCIFISRYMLIASKMFQINVIDFHQI